MTSSGSKGNRIFYTRSIPVCGRAQAAYFRIEYEKADRHLLDPIIKDWWHRCIRPRAAIRLEMNIASCAPEQTTALPTQFHFPAGPDAVALARAAQMRSRLSE